MKLLCAGYFLALFHYANPICNPSVFLKNSYSQRSTNLKKFTSRGVFHHKPTRCFSNSFHPEIETFQRLSTKLDTPL
jgi:hypothetical protein